METDVYRCGLSQCPVATSGICLNGFDELTRCRNFGQEPGSAAAIDFFPESTDDNVPEVLGGPVEPQWQSIDPGVQIGADTVSQILRRGAGRVVVLAGEIESGKTTLLASIYEAYHGGPYAGCAFSGSRTLRAFEERSFLARLDSGLDTPVTVRTSFQDSGFLHLRLRRLGAERSSGAAFCDLLLWDFTGEVFERARDDQSEAAKLTVLRAADRMVLLVDGARLAERRTRASTRTDARTLLLSVVQAGSLPAHSLVDIVITKWDAVIDALGTSASELLLAQIRAFFETEFGRLVARVTVDAVAARPEVGDLPPGYNVEPLLSSWLEEVPTRRYVAAEPAEVAPGARSFDLFSMRQIK